MHVAVQIGGILKIKCYRHRYMNYKYTAGKKTQQQGAEHRAFIQILECLLPRGFQACAQTLDRKSCITGCMQVYRTSSHLLYHPISSILCPSSLWPLGVPMAEP